jgi:membrane-associated phospholipid phosphatase
MNELDRNISSCLYSLGQRHSFLGLVAQAIGMSSDGKLWFPGLMLSALFSRSRAFSIEALIGISICAACELSIKQLVKRERPRLKINAKKRFIDAESYSFPSGHTARAWYLSLFLISHFAAQSSGPLFFILWACGVALSRVVCGRHWFGDVAGGSALGILVYFALSPMASRLTRRIV